jgi:GMP synthase-like glutamine amidotransferase
MHAGRDLFPGIPAAARSLSPGLGRIEYAGIGMRIHCFQHAACEGPGAIADWARARGHAMTFTRLHAGDPVPALDAIDLAVVMGGPMNIYQYRDHPWLREERAALAAHAAAGKRAIGICLGAQLLADALGARVCQNAHREIGWFPVHFTAEARARLPCLPGSETVIHWHGDTFDLPPGALRIGASAACPEQGFLFDDRILGLQFHPEMTPAALAALVEEEGGEPPPGPFVQSRAALLGHAPSDYEGPRRTLTTLLDALFGVEG